MIPASGTRSFLPSTQAKAFSLRLCRTPLLEPNRQNPRQRKSAASWSRGWCGATCALHSHKHKHSHSHKHQQTRSSDFCESTKRRRDSSCTRWIHHLRSSVQMKKKKMSLTLLLCKYFFSRTRWAHMHTQAKCVIVQGNMCSWRNGPEITVLGFSVMEMFRMSVWQPSGEHHLHPALQGGGGGLVVKQCFRVLGSLLTHASGCRSIFSVKGGLCMSVWERPQVTWQILTCVQRAQVGASPRGLSVFFFFLFCRKIKDKCHGSVRRSESALMPDARPRSRWGCVSWAY